MPKEPKRPCPCGLSLLATEHPEGWCEAGQLANLREKKRERPLDMAAEAGLLMLYLGAAVAGLGCDGPLPSRQRARETAEQLWQLLPFVKALLALGREHPDALLAHWREALQEPMPFGCAPLGVPQSEEPGDA